jgi:hypothetical protein
MSAASGLILSRISAVIAPVPAPSSTTNFAFCKSAPEIIASASFRELGATAPVIFG